MKYFDFESINKIIDLYKNMDINYLKAASHAAQIMSNPDIQKSLSFAQFYHQLKTEKRFFCQHDFFDILYDSFTQFSSNIDADVFIYRARRMNIDELDKRKDEIGEANYKTEPFKGFDKSGSFVRPTEEITANRANTRGIPCLYVGDSITTAISEVKPYKGTRVSVAKIKLKRQLRIYRVYPEFDDYELKLKDFMAKYPGWYRSLANMFSIPYENNDKNEYLITQCISEYVRISEKFDGIAYRSSLNDNGLNYAIFGCECGDYSLCEPVESNVYFIKNIDVQYEENRY